jgi:conjugal transfer/entry exclusion protein
MPSKKQFDELQQLDLRRQSQIRNQIDIINRLLAQVNNYKYGMNQMREVFSNPAEMVMTAGVVDMINAIEARYSEPLDTDSVVIRVRDAASWTPDTP